MKGNILMMFLLAFSSNLVFAQNDSSRREPANDGIIVCGIELPSFPGGDTAFRNYLQKNIVYPDSAKKYGKEGTVYVAFEVFPDGSIHHVYVRKGVPGAPELDAEAERVVKAMPDWTRVNDPNATKVMMVVPIKFQLE